MRALPHTLRSVAAPAGACLRVTITGEAGGEWLAVRQADRWILGRDPARPADAAVTLDQDRAWRLFTKGLTRDAALQAVRMTGDRALAGAALDMVAIIA